MEESGGEWTQDDLVKLVRAAEKFPVLYTTEVYQDNPTRRARDVAWKEVAAAVGKDRELCKMKYMSLRNTVKRDIREHRVNRSWWLKPHLQYLYTRIRKETLEEGVEEGGDGEEEPASADTTLSEVGEWGRDNTLRLVAAVADFPVLWNPAFADDRTAKDACWDSVADVVGQDKSECKHKFRNLRGMVAREKKRGKDETSQWWLKPHLYYLYSPDSTQPPHKMIKVEKSDPVEESERSEDEDGEAPCEEVDSFRLQYTRTSPRNATSKLCDHTEKLANAENRGAKRAGKRKASQINTANSGVLNETLRCVQKILGWANPRAGARDDLDIFSEYIAAELRQVKDPAAVHKAKRLIVRVVEQAHDSLESSEPRSSVISGTEDTSRLNPENSQYSPLPGSSKHSEEQGASKHSVEQSRSDELNGLLDWHVSVSETYNTGDQAK